MVSDNQFKNMKTEILRNMRMMDTTIKGVSSTPEYKENCAYNNGVRDTLKIVERYYQVTSPKEARTERLVQPTFLHNTSDTVSVWQCKCGVRFKTHHESGVLNGTDIMYCSKCGVQFSWKEQ